MDVFNRDPLKRKATEIAAKEEKNPHPNISSANITELVE